MGKPADASSDQARTDDFDFVSKLPEGPQRFLARAIAHGLERGRRTPGDFIRHFPPSEIMKGLAGNAERRAFILASTTGMKEKIALKKSWEDAARDLDLAMAEAETNAEAVVKLFAADDRVRHLDAQKLWDFLSEGEFWNAAPADKTATKVAREHVAYLLEGALEEELIDQRDVVEAITVPELSDRLPREHLGALLRVALENGKERRTFTAVDLIATTGPRLLVQHVPLTHLWNKVVHPRIARRHGYLPSEDAAALGAPLDDGPAESDSTALLPYDAEEITRVMPGAALTAELGSGVTSSNGQRGTRDDPFDVEEVEGFMVPIEDAVKAV